MYYQVPIHAFHAYDALMTYARALTEVLEQGHDPRNGTAIMERIRSRSYYSILGYNVIFVIIRLTTKLSSTIIIKDNICTLIKYRHTVVVVENE